MNIALNIHYFVKFCVHLKNYNFVRYLQFNLEQLFVRLLALLNLLSQIFFIYNMFVYNLSNAQKTVYSLSIPSTNKSIKLYN